jgi:hypothetical protein
MTRWAALAISLPVWTLGYLGWWIVTGPTIGDTLGGPVGISAERALQITAAHLDWFYFYQLPRLAIWLAGYAFIAILAVRATRPRVALVAIWLAVIVGAAILGRPLPVQPTA